MRALEGSAAAGPEKFSAPRKIDRTHYHKFLLPLSWAMTPIMANATTPITINLIIFVRGDPKGIGTINPSLVEQVKGKENRVSRTFSPLPIFLPFAIRPFIRGSSRGALSRGYQFGDRRGL